jgi:peptidoglycan hydrolase-like protein with peptidoglycan-binding domain
VLTRLHNLGYPGGEHEDDDATRAAVRSFQSDSGLAATGAIDDATRAKLREIYCV